MPLDIAVIPKEVSVNFGDEMRARVAGDSKLFAIHQHGYAHQNHEREDRKCEFGTARSKRQQLRDIAAGQQILTDFFDDLPLPIFTPPWNRCTNETVEVLCQLGFKILSRESKAEALNVTSLSEIPISIDWFAKRKRVALTREEIGALLANAITTQGEVGIMLHHALMDREERERLSELFELFAQYGQIEKHSIWSLFRASQTDVASFAHVN